MSAPIKFEIRHGVRTLAKLEAIEKEIVCIKKFCVAAQKECERVRRQLEELRRAS